MILFARRLPVENYCSKRVLSVFLSLRAGIEVHNRIHAGRVCYGAPLSDHRFSNSRADNSSNLGANKWLSANATR